MGKLELIREGLRESISMDATDIYIDFRDAKDKKEMVRILCDQNLKLNREEMLDVLEDLGFKVGKMRRKPMDPAAKEKWHREHPNNGGKKKAPEPEKNFLDEFAESLKAKESAPAPAKKPFAITQEMLDIANEIRAKQIEVNELLDRLDELNLKAQALGIRVNTL